MGDDVDGQDLARRSDAGARRTTRPAASAALAPIPSLTTAPTRDVGAATRRLTAKVVSAEAAQITTRWRTKRAAVRSSVIRRCAMLMAVAQYAHASVHHVTATAALV
jgi:hypothetical protein